MFYYRNLIARISKIHVQILSVLICLVLCFGANATFASAKFSPQLPSTNTSGNYTLSWTGGTTGIVAINEQYNGVWAAPAYFQTNSGSLDLKNKALGPYVYQIAECTPPPPRAQFPVCGQVLDSTSITVIPPVPVITASFDKTTINEAESARFTWSTTNNATDCSATGINGVTGPSGSTNYSAPSVMSADLAVKVTISCMNTTGTSKVDVYLTVKYVNDAPTMTAISAVSVGANSSTGPLVLIMSDEETPLSSLVVTATSSNTSVIPNANISLGSNGVYRVINITATNIIGSSDITVTVSDGQMSTSRTFTVTVNPLPPVVSASFDKTTINESESAKLTWSATGATSCSATGISGVSGLSGNLIYNAPTVMSVDQAVQVRVSCTGVGGTSNADANLIVKYINDAPTITQFSSVQLTGNTSSGPIYFTVADEETSASSLTVTAVSSNQSVIPNGNISLGIVNGGSRVLSLSAPNVSGSATITVTVSDGQQTSSGSFTVTVNAVQLPPVVSAYFDKTTINESESATLTWSSTGATSCSATGISGVSGLSGNLIYNAPTVMSVDQAVQVRVSCTGVGGTSNADANLVVKYVNDAPTITPFSSIQLTGNTSSGPIYFTVSDEETSAGSLTVTAVSSNQTVIPSANLSLGTVNGGSRVLNISAPNVSGSSTITVTVSDGQQISSSSFTVTVNAVQLPPVVSAYFDKTTINESESATLTWSATGATSCSATGISGVNGLSGNVIYNAPTVMSADQIVPIRVSCTGAGGTSNADVNLTVKYVNDAPTITPFSSIQLTGNTASGPIYFTVADEETSAGSLTVTAVSSNQAVIPNGSLSLGTVSGGSRVLNISAPNVSGVATITVTVSDGQQTSSSSFAITVSSQVSKPIITPNGGFFTGSTNVHIQSDTVGAVIRYTSDGSAVTSSSPIFMSDFVIAASTTIKAKAFMVGMVDSEEAGVALTGLVADPVFNPAAGTYADSVKVSISSTPNAVIRYTLDGSSVTETSLVFASEIIISNTQTLKSKAFKSGLNPSKEVVGVYTVTHSPSSPDPTKPFDPATELPVNFSYPLDDAGIPSLGSSQFVATTAGALDVQNGSAQYQVKIDLPPAVRELKPKLALNYNSRAANGLMGLGWSLSGLSSITRCRSSFATDGADAQKSNPRYTNADRLCLDGQKLVIADSAITVNDASYWSGNTIYRTEIDNFSKIQAFGSQSSSNQYFKVWTKDGLVMTYGREEEGQNSRIYAPGQGNGPVSQWALDKVEDLYGNKYTVSYIRDTAKGEFYPSVINFAPNALVVFSYKDRSGNTPWGYDGGNKYEATKLLNKISTYVDVASSGVPVNGTPVKEYVIDYMQSATTDRSLVKQIQECGFTNNARQCAKPLSFSWQAGEVGFESSMRSLEMTDGTSFKNLAYFDDINDDGYVDAIGKKRVIGWGTPTGKFQPTGFEETEDFYEITTRQGKAGIVVKLRQADHQEDVYLAQFNSNSTQVIYTFIASFPIRELTGYADERPVILTGDFNNDGLTDFIVQLSSNNLHMTTVWLQNNISAAPRFIASLVSGDPIGGSEPMLAELTGDGLVDLSVAQQLYQDSLSRDRNLACVNVDQGDHLAGVSNCVRASQLPKSVEVGGSGSTSGALSHPSYRTIGLLRSLVDINGDGHKDMLYQDSAIDDPTQKPTDWAIRLNVGDASTWGSLTQVDTKIPVVPQAIGGAQAFSAAQYNFSYDYNKDGIEDLILWTGPGLADWNGDGLLDGHLRHWHVFYTHYENGGLSFTDSGIDPFMGSADYLDLKLIAGELDNDNMFRGDVNNDGLMDVVFPDISKPDTYKYRTAKQSQPDLLQSVSDGFGAETRIEYSPLVNDANNGKPLYTPDAVIPVFPQAPANRSMQVVKKISVSNGQGGFNDRFFNYSGAKMDLQGRGFLGFANIQITDVVTGLVTSTDYRQGFPYTGKVDFSTVKTVAGDLISSIKSVYAIHPNNARFPYVDYSLQKSYQLTTADINNPLSASKIKNVFDACGNLTDQVVDTGTSISGSDVVGLLNRQHTVNSINNNSTADCSDDFVYSRTQEVSKVGGSDLKTTVTNFEPNAAKEVAKIIAFAGTPQQQITTIDRAANGVVIGNTQVANDIDSGSMFARSTTYSDLQKGLFPQTVTNTLVSGNHVTTFNYDYRFGEQSLVKLPNGQTTTTSYDYLGRATDQYLPDSRHREIISFYCGSSAPVVCPVGGVYGVATRVTNLIANGLGEPLSIVYYDSLQREVRRSVYAMNGQAVTTDKLYASDGRLAKVSEPFVISNGSGAASAWTVYSNYDALGRVHNIASADGGSQAISYEKSGANLKVTESTTVVGTNKYDVQTTQRFINPLGQVEKVIDANNTPVDYTYNSLGSLETTKVNGNSDTLISLGYDAQGNKTHIQDPDAGIIDFEYNGFGELRRQTWQKGTSFAKSMVLGYDQLGRQITRDDKAVSGSTTSYQWIWDTKQKGLLSIESGNGQTIEYGYDGFARVKTFKTTITGLGDRTFIYDYDNFSRPTTITYPNGFIVKRKYHAAGMQVQTKDASGSTEALLWALGNDIDSRGNFSNQLWGNGVVTQSQFDPLNGQLKRITSGRLSGANKVNGLFGDIQALTYDADSAGNILSRTSQRTNGTGTALEYEKETFVYDKLNRLTSSVTSGLFARFQDYTYDELGNLKSRSNTSVLGGANSDIGALTYDRSNGAGVHAVTAAGGQTYQYDKYGNMIKRGADTIAYDVFNKPMRVTGSSVTAIDYDANHNRFREGNGSTLTFTIAGGLYEEIQTPSTTTQKSYVDGVVVNSKTLSGSIVVGTSTLYVHTDHLGSGEAISDKLGAFVNRMSFSDWGKRQQADWRSGSPSSIFPTANGFTGQHQMDQHNLVHMGGRVYDPRLGRFLSADLFIQSPYSSQSYNRYSYVSNNPLSRIDPTGYEDDPVDEIVLRGLRPDYSRYADAAYNSAMQSMLESFRNPLEDYFPPRESVLDLFSVQEVPINSKFDGTDKDKEQAEIQTVTVVGVKDNELEKRGKGVSLVLVVTGARVDRIAQTWYGTPYAKYGSPNDGPDAVKGLAADCSGAVFKIYSEANLPYPYTPATPSLWKKGVESGMLPFQKVSSPQIGDVVLFNGHMGIYTSTQGNKDIWSAQSGANQFQAGMSSWFDGPAIYYRYLQ